MATLTTALNTSFTPAAGDFIAQVTGAPVSLLRRNTSGAAWAFVAELKNQAVIVGNPIAGADYKFVPADGAATAAVQADQ